ncbi:hypothetical protein ACJ41O_006110 [Fusarium nematophilum]
MIRPWVLVLLLCHIAVSSGAPNSSVYRQCQTVDPKRPRHGCPPGTLFVSSTSPKADFKSIQDAIRSLPQDNSPRVILIGAGNYTEQLNVTRPGPLTLLGETRTPKRLENADISEEGPSKNKVQVFWNAANGNGKYVDNLLTSVLVVGPTYEATLTGSGPTGYPVPADTPFGCSDFRAYSIDFRNEYAPRSSGPAHALAVAYANAGFYSCGFYSYQDTIFAGKLGNVFMHDSIIAGQTDFLYGFGTLFIERSTLLMRGCGGGITAWKGTNTTFANKYGVYISQSRTIASNDTVATDLKGRCSLGRPWNALHRSVYMDTYLDGTVLPAGYTSWAGQPNGNFGINTTMAVYRTYGPGNDRQKQEESNVTTIFTRSQARSYLRPKDVFMDLDGRQPYVSWIDSKWGRY